MGTLEGISDFSANWFSNFQVRLFSSAKQDSPTINMAQPTVINGGSIWFWGVSANEKSRSKSAAATGLDPSELYLWTNSSAFAPVVVPHWKLPEDETQIPWRRSALDNI